MGKHMIELKMKLMVDCKKNEIGNLPLNIPDVTIAVSIRGWAGIIVITPRIIIRPDESTDGVQ